MRLSARPIITFSNINSFVYGNQWIVRAGDPLTLYFQIVDLDQGPSAVIGGSYGSLNESSQLSGGVGIRYLPGVSEGTTPVQVIVKFPSIDDQLVIETIATVADPNDGSIWRVSLGSNQIPMGGSVQFSISEGSMTRRFKVLGMLSVETMNDGSC